MKLAASKATSAKILASVVLVGGAASVAGLGTFGAFTDTTSASQAVAAGTVVLDEGTSALKTSVVAAKMVPGDSIQRSITLARGAESEAFSNVTLSTTSTGSLLTGTQAGSLTLSIDSCTTAWTVAAADSKVLTCAGTTTSVLSSSTTVGANRALTGVTALLNGTTKAANLRATLTLPATAGNNLQGLSDTLTFTFDATQRAAQNL